MFNEILKSVDEFINGRLLFDEKDIVNNSIVQYLSLGYDIPANSISNTARIKMDKIPDIILVAIDYDLPNRICDYIFYEGELVKVISFAPQLWNKSEANMIAMILAILGDINNSLIESYRPYIDQQMSANSFVDTLTYAPFIMATAYIQKRLPFITDQVISITFKLMYPKVTEKSISSARKLVSQFSVGDLLDRCIWYGVTNREYPDIRFCELKDPVAKTLVPGKGIWNLSDMQNSNEESDDLEDPAEDENDYQGMSDEELANFLAAQDEYEDEMAKKQEDHFTVPLEDIDPSASVTGRDTRKPISYNKFPGGKNNG